MTDLNTTQKAFTSGILSTELFSRIDYSKITSGLKQCENFIVRPAGGVTYRTGTSYVYKLAQNYESVAYKMIPFNISPTEAYCVVLTDCMAYIFNENGYVTHIDTSFFTETRIQGIKYAQHKNKLYLVHPERRPIILEKTDNGFNLDYAGFKTPPQSNITSVNITAKDPKNEDTVVAFRGWQYAVSTVYEVDGKEIESFPVYSNKIIKSDIDLANQNIEIKIYANLTINQFKHFNVYKIKAGEFYLCYKLTGSAGVIYNMDDTVNYYVLTDIGFAPATNKAPKEAFKGFGTNNNYPSAVGIWNQRLVYASTKEKPSTLWFSRVNEFNDFTSSILNNPEEGMELTISSKDNDTIKELVNMDNLIVMTQGKIWRISGTSLTNMSAVIESHSGTSGLSPFVTKKSILYVEPSKNKVSNFIYSYELNGYTGSQLDILARDLFDGYEITGLSYGENPYGVLYAVRDDGALLGLTYMREENIYAWHKHTTQNGSFKDVCVITKEDKDYVFCLVERTTETGNKILFVERFEQQINQKQDSSDSCHLDCAQHFENIHDFQIANYEVYYNGLTVRADNDVFHFDNIQNNKISLPRVYKKITVGLPYMGIIETIPSELAYSNGNTTVGYNRRIHDGVLRYYRTRGLKYGRVLDNLYELKPYTEETYGEEIPLETGEQVLRVSDGFSLENTFFVVQDNPFPATIQSITLGSTMNGKS